MIVGTERVGDVLQKMKKYIETASGNGHTLIELLIAMFVALVAMGAIYSVYYVQQRQHYNQHLVLKARQNIRGALIVTEQQIRMAGYDPESSGLFGIKDIRRYDLIGTQPNPQGMPALIFTRDMNENGKFDGGNEQIKFCIREEKGTGKKYLAWNMGSGRFPLAENIEGIGFAYAVDVNGDGLPDKCAETEHFIWAMDSDNDNRLDTNLDSNCDGYINEKDDRDGDHRITPSDGAGLNPPIELNHIKAIRIWMLTVTSRPVKGQLSRKTFVLGDRIYKPGEDEYQRNDTETIVYCRNL